MGLAYALIGAAIAVFASGIGSSIGVAGAAQAATGVISEDPDKFGKTMVLQLLPASQALYGFIVAFLVILFTVMNETVRTAGISVEKGLMYLAMCLPVGIVGCVSAIYQGKVCVAGINMVGKRPEMSGRGMTMAAFVEFFALFALVASIIGVLQVNAMA